MLVSILIPVYNTAAYLPQCMESIVVQTHRELQVVVVDDGSTDESMAVAQTYAEKFPFIEVYHQENAGVAEARNHLLRRVRGEYVLFVDSDDWIEPDMVEFLLNKAQECQAEIVTCGMVVNDTAVSRAYSQQIWNREQTVKTFLFHRELSGSLCNKLVKTSLLHSLRFEKGISYGEDALFCWHVLQRISSLCQTNRQLYHYRRNLASISHQQWTPEKKGTGYIVWQKICEDTAANWPQYHEIALATSAMESMWALYFTSISGYPYDENIHERQLHLRAHFFCICKHSRTSFSKYAVAVLLSYWYGFGCLLKLIKG